MGGPAWMRGKQQLQPKSVVEAGTPKDANHKDVTEAGGSRTKGCRGHGFCASPCGKPCPCEDKGGIFSPM
eukprot:8451748-Pyramimonas_sp.AAC.1